MSKFGFGRSWEDEFSNGLFFAAIVEETLFRIWNLFSELREHLPSGKTIYFKLCPLLPNRVHQSEIRCVNSSDRCCFFRNYPANLCADSLCPMSNLYPS